MTEGWRSAVPWWARIGLKLVMARLPVPYRLWKRLRLFEHGAMDQPATAVGTLLDHARSAGVLAEGGGQPRFVSRPGFTVLEIGPGDSLASGVVARALGAECSILVDSGDFATRDPMQYKALITYLVAQGYAPPLPAMPDGIEPLLRACGVTYLTQGVDSLATLPSQCVDFCFSNAVLEHVSKVDFDRMAVELRRVLRPGGVSVHRVDFRDHLGGGLNNLRFSPEVWEGRLFSRSGFYTNRIRPRAMRASFEAAGFRCEVIREVRWPQVPIARAALHPQFRDLPDDELLLSGLDLRLL